MATTQQAASSGATVVVGCKLPHGLHLDSHDAQGNLLQRFTLNGYNSAPRGQNGEVLVGAYGITRGVPKDVFEAWLKLHKDAAYVKNELVFAHGDTESVQDHGDDLKTHKSGFEGLDVSKPSNGIEKAQV